MTTALEKAFHSLRALPAAEPDKLGEILLTYASRWRDLKAGIEQGAAELDRGEGIEITDIQDLVDELTNKDGRP